MLLKQDILANYTGAAITIAAPLLALPWYLSLLGPQQFGLVGLATMFQALLGLIDTGISQALVGEFSTRFHQGRQGTKLCATLLSGFERIYWAVALLFGGIMFLSADWIATHWLYTDGVDPESALLAIYGASAMFMAQFPGAIYRSLFTGTQNHVTFNKILVSSMVARHLGGVVILLLWPSLLSFFIWHTLVILADTLVRFKLAWRILTPENFLHQWGVLKEIRSVGTSVTYLSLSVVLGALTLQADKLILSHMAPVSELGYYVIAATIATGLLQAIYPLTQTLLPVAAQHSTDPIKIKRTYQRLFMTIALAVLAGVILFFLAGKLLLGLWLNSSESAQHVYPILSILLIGTGLNALYNIGYVHWLATKKIYRILTVNLLGIITTFTATPFFIHLYGTPGAAFGWIILNIIGLMLSLEWAFTNKKNIDLEDKVHEPNNRQTKNIFTL